MSRSRPLQTAVIVALVAMVYFAAAKVGLRLAFLNASATAVWPPTGISIAAFLIFGYRVWPGILLGAFAANLTTAGTIDTSLGIAIGNTVEGALACFLVRRFAAGRRAFEQPTNVFRYAVLAGAVSTAISATLGVSVLAARGFVDAGLYATVWRTWWAGDAGGALVLAPCLLLWSRRRSPLSVKPRRPVEVAGVFAALAATGVLIFGGFFPWSHRHYALEFLCVPVLLWAAFRLSPRLASLAVVLLSGIAVWGTLNGNGPFSGDSQNEALVLLQSFMAVVSVMVLAVAATVCQRRRTEARVRRFNARLEGRVAQRTRELSVAYDALRDELRQREATELELTRSDARLREAQRLAHIGSWEWEIEPNKIIWSDELYSLYGLDRETFGASYEAFLERVHPDDRDRIRSAIEAAYADGRPFSFEHRIVRPDGTVRIHHGQGGVVLDADGRPVRMMGTGQDITDRNRAEEERASLLQEQVARREAEDASRMKDVFLAMLSHELRTPLTSIVGWAHLLQTGALDAETTARGIETISRNAQIQSHLISDLLDISRLVSGRFELERRSVDLATSIEGALDTMRPAAQAKNITLHSNLQAGLPPLMGDADRLQQIMGNLLSNAIKFVPRGGNVWVTLSAANQIARMRVEDDGPGIAPEFLPDIFERFRQQDASRARKLGGLGLGLALVKHLVELHGGRVVAENRESQSGSVFTVTLPLPADVPATTRPGPRAADAPTARTADRLVRPLQSLHVLLVEDDTDSRELIAVLIAGCGANVRAVSSSAEALVELGRHRPDVLISDIEMPDETGYDLIAKVRAGARGNGDRLPAIALTAHAGQEHAGAALRAGFDAYLSKPLDLDALIGVILELVARRAASRRS